jgi:hypothetical protein
LKTVGPGNSTIADLVSLRTVGRVSLTIGVLHFGIARHSRTADRARMTAMKLGHAGGPAHAEVAAGALPEADPLVDALAAAVALVHGVRRRKAAS